MILISTKEEYETAKSEESLLCFCHNCNKSFPARKANITHEIKYNRGRVKFCSPSCNSMSQFTQVLVMCKNCGKEFQKKSSQVKKHPNHFCSSSCAATYNNTHKTKGIRRSKLESYIQEQLTYLYPTLEIHFNKKDTISSELDIYIPSLRLAIELNGIFHYKPIYGLKKLSQNETSDKRKVQMCLEKEIYLLTINTSEQKVFSEKTSQPYLHQVIEAIENTFQQNHD